MSLRWGTDFCNGGFRSSEKWNVASECYDTLTAICASSRMSCRKTERSIGMLRYTMSSPDIVDKLCPSKRRRALLEGARRFDLTYAAKYTTSGVLYCNAVCKRLLLYIFIESAVSSLANSMDGNTLERPNSCLSIPLTLSATALS